MPRPRRPLTSSEPGSPCLLLLGTRDSPFCNPFAFHQENGAIKDTRLSLCGHFSSASLPTCPACVYRYAASATLSIKGTSQIDDETVSLWWARRYSGDGQWWTRSPLDERSSTSSSSKCKHMIYLSNIPDEIWHYLYFLFYDTNVIFIHLDISHWQDVICRMLLYQIII